MLRILAASLLLSPAVARTDAGGDAAPISLDDIEMAKSARLMKNKEDIDVQSTFHEDDIKGTGDIPDELAARLVRNRGPITAKITASGSHSRYCDEGGDDEGCSVRFSLVAWKFAGDEGTVHGEYQERYPDGDVARVDVDCMAREDGAAVVGGSVREAPGRHPAGRKDDAARRAYVRVVDGGDAGRGDFVSGALFDDGVRYPDCRAPGLDGALEVDYEANAAGPRVSVCSKHGDWEGCLAKGKTEQAIE